MKLLIRGAHQVVQVVSDDRRFLRGEKEMKELDILQRKPGDEDGFSIAVNHNGLIEAIGRDSELDAKYLGCPFDQVLDLEMKKSVIPGLIDGHTHPVWAGDRVHEFALKLSGASYMEVHKAGGGINFTVEKTRKATQQQLELLFLQRVEAMKRAGTTTVECKSGYGLDVENEVKMLKALESAASKTKVEISQTFCGAHSVPKGLTPDEATENVLSVQLPEIVRLNEIGDLHVENIDVFCEKGVFNVEQTRRILQKGKQHGLRINFHGEELSCLGSAEMGSSLNSEAISHLEEISPSGIESMSASGTVAVILPTTAYILRLKSPPVREMIKKGVIVALGTDFNPNAYCLAMPTVMHLACVNQHLSLNESLAAATINAAHSIGRSNTHGSIQVGKWADFVVIEEQNWEHLVYQLSGHHETIGYVIKRGDVIHKKKI